MSHGCFFHWGKKEIFNNWCNQKYVYMYLFYLLDEQDFLIESHRKKTLKIKIADLEADLEVFQFKHFQSFYTCRKKTAVTITAAEYNF